MGQSLVGLVGQSCKRAYITMADVLGQCAISGCNGRQVKNTTMSYHDPYQDSVLSSLRIYSAAKHILRTKIQDFLNVKI